MSHQERERNWAVPVSIRDRYWSASFYAAGYRTAEDAEQAVRVAVEQLPLVLDGKLSPDEFRVGPATAL